MKWFHVVLILVAMVIEAKAEEKDPCGGILVADTAFPTPTCVREYKTALGRFVIKVNFSGGSRREVVVSPKGQETEMRSVALLRAMVGKVWAVDSIGVWLYDQKTGTFIEIKRLDDEMVDRCFSTKNGDFCALLPRSGESKFAGLLYFDKTSREWVEAKYPAEAMPDFVVDSIKESRTDGWILISAKWYDDLHLVPAAGFIWYNKLRRSFSL